MKIRINKTELLRVLKDAKVGMGKKTPIAIANNVKVEAAEGEAAVFTCTDCESAVVASAACQIEEPGKTTIPFAILFAAVSKFADGVVSVDADDKNAVVSCGSSRFRIATLPAEAFPEIPAIAAETEFPIYQPVLRMLMEKTVYAASKDSMRPVLNSVFLEADESGIRSVSTDGRRLSLYGIDDGWDKCFKAVVPSTSALAIANFAGNVGEAAVALGNGRLAVDFGKTRYYTKLYDGAYPNYRQVIPEAPAVSVDVDRAALLEAVARVNVMSDSETPIVRLSFASNQVVVDANTSQVGSARDVVPVKYDGAKIEIRFNPNYVLDVLRNFESDEVSIHMDGETRPVLLRAAKTFIAVLMPMKK